MKHYGPIMGSELTPKERWTHLQELPSPAWNFLKNWKSMVETLANCDMVPKLWSKKWFFKKNNKFEVSGSNIKGLNKVIWEKTPWLKKIQLSQASHVFFVQRWKLNVCCPKLILNPMRGHGSKEDVRLQLCLHRELLLREFVIRWLAWPQELQSMWQRYV